ncbi:MAG: hypothetical protein A2017_09645 [Lentisphaerae bacterium GWF2_44_16]|nr:MAG: hypothetical protein A2017_09645 [Lentisphaerae bacterium GWF2_44_16]
MLFQFVGTYRIPFECSLALLKAGRKMLASIAITAITIRSSSKVKTAYRAFSFVLLLISTYF